MAKRNPVEGAEPFGYDGLHKKGVSMKLVTTCSRCKMLNPRSAGVCVYCKQSLRPQPVSPLPPTVPPRPVPPATSLPSLWPGRRK